MKRLSQPATKPLVDVSSPLPEQRAGALNALARLRREACKQIAKLGRSSPCPQLSRRQDEPVQQSDVPPGTDKHTRRNVMGMMGSAAATTAGATFLASQPLVASSPSVATADPDAELMSLIDQLWALAPHLEQAKQRVDQTSKKHLARCPEYPEVTRWHPGDPVGYVWIQRRPDAKKEVFCNHDQIEERRDAPIMTYGKFRGTAAERKLFTGRDPRELSDEERHRHFPLEIDERQQKRFNEIRDAYDEYFRECDALRVQVGLAEAAAACDAVVEKQCALMDRIFEIDARTLAGFRAKARAHVHFYCGGDVGQLRADIYVQGLFYELIGGDDGPSTPAAGRANEIAAYRRQLAV